jgi:hypothetical protein
MNNKEKYLLVKLATATPRYPTPDPRDHERGPYGPEVPMSFAPDPIKPINRELGIIKQIQKLELLNMSRSAKSNLATLSGNPGVAAGLVGGGKGRNWSAEDLKDYINFEGVDPERLKREITRMEVERPEGYEERKRKADEEWQNKMDTMKELEALKDLHPVDEAP